MPLPFGRFVPAKGLTVDRTGNNVAIGGAMQCYGSEATAARCVTIQNTINSVWTATFPDGCSSVCQVVIMFRPPGVPSFGVTEIEIKSMSGPSNVNTSTKKMELNSNSADVYTWVAAHEFGHVIGLDDRYSEPLISKIRGSWGGQRTNEIQPGYEGNLMGAHNGAMSSQNIRDLASETSPSSWSTEDDDHIRAWVSAHSLADIAATPVDAKISAINTLMGGWISDADVDAMVKILQSVRNVSEANVIRTRIDPVTCSGLGQRTRVRVAMAGMPS